MVVEKNRGDRRDIHGLMMVLKPKKDMFVQRQPLQKQHREVSRTSPASAELCKLVQAFFCVFFFF